MLLKDFLESIKITNAQYTIIGTNEVIRRNIKKRDIAASLYKSNVLNFLITEQKNRLGNLKLVIEIKLNVGII